MNYYAEYGGCADFDCFCRGEWSIIQIYRLDNHEKVWENDFSYEEDRSKTKAEFLAALEKFPCDNIDWESLKDEESSIWDWIR